VSVEADPYRKLTAPRSLNRHQVLDDADDVAPLVAFCDPAHDRVSTGVARLQPPLDVDQLTLGEELAADLGQPIPRHQVVVLGALRCPIATKLVRGDHRNSSRCQIAERAALGRRRYDVLIGTRQSI
jgi:hypothetical protein